MISRPRRFLFSPFLLALAGLLFAIWNLTAGAPESGCVTTGCSLFQDFRLAGVSLWWLGVAGFGLLLVLAAVGAAGLGTLCAGLGLLLDCGLLLVMLWTAPCLYCLLIGLLLALTYLAFRRARREAGAGGGRPPRRRSVLAGVWAFVFLLVIAVLIHSAVGPWALTTPSGPTPASATTLVYFSPSCRACRDLVATGAGANAAWYPVAENGRDVWIIADMARRTAEGADVAAALDAALTAAPENVPPQNMLTPAMLWMQFRVWRNHAHVANSGASTLPFVEFRGSPAALMGNAAGATGSAGAAGSAARAAAPGDAPWLRVTGSCEQGVPCESAPQNGAGQNNGVSAAMGGTK